MPEPSEQKIRLMDDVLASQVAAGEVVERPASVVKELVENSIDAGADVIRVEIRRGGVSLIKVTDNGSGMSREDVGMCLLRHATSKLYSSADLFDIKQLGFRGEALPSIASVSLVSITTRRAEDVEGSRISCEGGVISPLTNAGCAPGTEMSVANLFFNTPVRRKFLKSDETEAGHVEHQVRLHALAFPHIRFVFVRDGQVVFDVPGTQDLRQRIAGFIGREMASALMRIRPTEAPGVRVRGFLMPLSAARRNRRMQFFFLNGRPIEDTIITRAVRDGYGGFPTGQHPALFLYLEVEPALVDVNVHPAKREVRFRRPSELTMAVLEAVASTLAAHARGGDMPEEKTSSVPAPTVPPLVLRPVVQPVQQELTLPPSEPQRKAPPTPLPLLREKTESPTPARLPEPQARKAAPTAPECPSEDVPGFRHIGTLKEQYALFENSEGLVLMAPRAARERIIFERLLQSERRPMESQRLLVPEMIEMDVRDMGVVRDIQPQLEQAGFHVAEFGRNTLRLEAVPVFLPLQQASVFVHELLQVYTRGELRLNRNRNPFEPFARQLAARYARQENAARWLAEPMRLLAQLLRCEIPYCTPGGKPTLLPFPMSEIQRKLQAQ